MPPSSDKSIHTNQLLFKANINVFLPVFFCGISELICLSLKEADWWLNPGNIRTDWKLCLLEVSKMDEWDFEVQIVASQLPCRLTGGRYLIKLFFFPPLFCHCRSQGDKTLCLPLNKTPFCKSPSLGLSHPKWSVWGPFVEPQFGSSQTFEWKQRTKRHT